MELQINRLETGLRRCKKCLKKDLEEIKKNQSIMNNAITEIKSTLEGINSRITEAEERISEVDNRMVAINEAEMKKEELKKIRTTSETTGTMLNTPTFES